VPRLLPCSRTEFIRKLKALGYTGPYAGTKHQFMSKAGHANVRVPNPHEGDLSVGLIAKILRDSNIDRDAWINA
jgi:predicted RNA binding protein YcfA (HicA-like mRNA interferase family)